MHRQYSRTNSMVCCLSCSGWGLQVNDLLNTRQYHCCNSCGDQLQQPTAATTAPYIHRVFKMHSNSGRKYPGNKVNKMSCCQMGDRAIKWSTTRDRRLSYLECISSIVDEVDAQVVERHSGDSSDRCEHGYLEEFDGVAARACRLPDQRISHQTVGHDVAPAWLHLHVDRRVQRLFADPRQQLKRLSRYHPTVSLLYGWIYAQMRRGICAYIHVFRPYPLYMGRMGR